MSDVNGGVVGIQGRAVDAATPNDGDVYRWDAGNAKWVPVAPPQPLDPWVGSVNTQAQIIKRIPFVATLNGGGGGSIAVSTGISYNLSSGQALSMEVHWTSRRASPTAVNAGLSLGAIANVSGTMTTPHDFNGFAGVLSGSGGSSVNFTFDVSGSLVTLNVGAFLGAGLVVDVQGFVDLMVI